MAHLISSLDFEQHAWLVSQSTEQGAAKSRYAAAMYFYNQQLLDEEVLEIYRILTKRDTELPHAMLAAIGRLSDDGVVMLSKLPPSPP
jgi:hypothetical protein